MNLWMFRLKFIYFQTLCDYTCYPHFYHLKGEWDEQISDVSAQKYERIENVSVVKCFTVSACNLVRTCFALMTFWNNKSVCVNFLCFFFQPICGVIFTIYFCKRNKAQSTQEMQSRNTSWSNSWTCRRTPQRSEFI